MCNHIDGMCPSDCEPGWVAGLCSEGKSHMPLIMFFLSLSISNLKKNK